LRHERRITARNYTKDEGRPFAAGLQGQAANHLKLLEAKALVVSVEEKAPRRCQVWTTKMSASKPRTTCRNVKDDIKTRGLPAPGRNAAGTCLLAAWCPAYTWHERGLGLGVERGNLRHDAKRKPYKWPSHEGESIDACRRGGSSRSSEEVLVMRMERRG
jgi:hypothetical protein